MIEHPLDTAVAPQIIECVGDGILEAYRLFLDGIESCLPCRLKACNLICDTRPAAQEVAFDLRPLCRYSCLDLGCFVRPVLFPVRYMVFQRLPACTEVQLHALPFFGCIRLDLLRFPRPVRFEIGHILFHLIPAAVPVVFDRFPFLCGIFFHGVDAFCPIVLVAVPLLGNCVHHVCPACFHTVADFCKPIVNMCARFPVLPPDTDRKLSVFIMKGVKECFAPLLRVNVKCTERSSGGCVRGEECCNCNADCTSRKRRSACENGD